MAFLAVREIAIGFALTAPVNHPDGIVTREQVLGQFMILFGEIAQTRQDHNDSIGDGIFRMR